MRVIFNDDQEQIRATARAMLAQRAPLAGLAEIAESGEYDAVLWREIVDLGWAGIAVGEEHGGLGLGVIDLAILAEELGYAVAASPFLASAAATLLVEASGSDEQRRRWLPPLAAGEATATVASAAAGRAELVPDAGAAAAIVLVEGETGVLLESVEVEIEPVETIDPASAYARVIAGGAGEPLPGAVAAGIDRAELLLAANLVGIAQRALDLTLEFVGERRQFGTPVGAFQAVSHRCAEMLLETERARSCTYLAAWSADSATAELPAAASMAKAAASRAAAFATAAAIQLHGGLGFTWEAEVHWLFKRARVIAAGLGPASSHLARVARLAA